MAPAREPVDPAPHGAACEGGVSVVIPTYNRADSLLALLEGLAHQRDVGPFEVVVSDDGSSDDTVARAEALTGRLPYRLRVVTTPANTGPAGARNRGWRATGGSRVALIDDDCVPTPTWLAEMVRGLDGADIVIGRTRPPAAAAHELGPFSHYLDMQDNEGFLTCNIAYRREVLEELGGFGEESFRYQPNRKPEKMRCLLGDDTDVGLRAMRAGFTKAYLPEAVVEHEVGPSRFLPHLRDKQRLEGMVILTRRNPEWRMVSGGGYFHSSVDKAVLLAWAAFGAAALRPRPVRSAALVAAAVGVYGWQWPRTHPVPRRRRQLLSALPLSFVADSYGLLVMARASLRHRTLLL